MNHNMGFPGSTGSYIIDSKLQFMNYNSCSMIGIGFCDNTGLVGMQNFGCKKYQLATLIILDYSIILRLSMTIFVLISPLRYD